MTCFRRDCSQVHFGDLIDRLLSPYIALSGENRTSLTLLIIALHIITYHIIFKLIAQATDRFFAARALYPVNRAFALDPDHELDRLPRRVQA